jgi:hypothetical protein
LLVQHAGSPCKGGVTEPVKTVNEAARCMNQSLVRLAAPDDNKLPAKVPATAIELVFAEVRKSCALLPITSELSDTGETQTTNPGEARFKSCASLVFEPQLRFGGLRDFGKKDKAAARPVQDTQSAAAARP